MGHPTIPRLAACSRPIDEYRA